MGHRKDDKIYTYTYIHVHISVNYIYLLIDTGFTLCKNCKLVMHTNAATTKFAILDDNFFPRMMSEARNDKERGMVAILYYSGMHASSLLTLNRSNLKRIGSNHRLEWRRTKTARAMSCAIPSRYNEPVIAFLESRKPSRQYIHRVVKELGQKAGYDDISPMTFRHTRCVRAFMPKDQGGDGLPFFAVNQIMGCSMGVVVRNYAIMADHQLYSDVTESKEEEL